MEKAKKTLYQLRHPIAAMEADLAQRETIMSYKNDIFRKIIGGYPIDLTKVKTEIDRRYNMLGFFGIASHNAKIVAKDEIELLQRCYEKPAVNIEIGILPEGANKVVWSKNVNEAYQICKNSTKE
jgi:hypothetical protein